MQRAPYTTGQGQSLQNRIRQSHLSLRLVLQGRNHCYLYFLKERADSGFEHSSGVRQPRIESWLHLLQAVGPWASYLTSQ